MKGAAHDTMRDRKLLTRCVADIYRVLGLTDDDSDHEWDIVELWDDKDGVVPGGRSWSEQP